MANAASFRRLANSFNATQDEIHVNTIVVDWPGVTELNANLAAGTPPDIMVLHGRRIPNYASRGLLDALGRCARWGRHRR